MTTEMQAAPAIAAVGVKSIKRCGSRLSIADLSVLDHPCRFIGVYFHSREEYMKPGPDGIKLVQSFEGCERKTGNGQFAAYPDPGTGGDPWTIGWGTTGPDVKKGVVWTQKQCDDRFAADLDKFAQKVDAAIGGAATTQHQFDAMVSFAYNVGVANLQSSTLLKKHKAGDHTGAAAEFAKWNKAAGRVMPGLTRRRAAEAALYSSP